MQAHPPKPTCLRAGLVLLMLTLVFAACGGRRAVVRIEAVSPSPPVAALQTAPPGGGASSGLSMTATPVAATAPLALIVGFTFPLDDISTAEADALLAGTVHRWSEVGGPDLPVRELSWSARAVGTVPALHPEDAAVDATGRDALVAAVAAQPGSVALVVWDGPHLHSKGLSVDGRLPDAPGYPLMSALPAPPPSSGSFTVAAAGDLMLGRRVAQLTGSAVDYPLAQVAREFRSADLGFANLEVALTQRGDPAHKDYTFRAPENLAEGLRDSGINIVSVANNHVLDYGSLGLADTLAALDSAGVSHAGAGDDAAAAAAPAIVTVRGTRIAVLSFVNVPNDSVTGFVAQSMAAQAGKPGVNWGTPGAVTREVEAARAQADVVIVSMHAGIEYADQPDAVQEALAHAAIDAGAALVIGAHPHVLQGIEYYRDGVILYSLGNFVFDLDNADVLHYGLPAVQTVVARVTFSGNTVQGLELLPAMVDTSQYRPVPAAGAAARAVLDRVYRLTDALASAGAVTGDATPGLAPSTADCGSAVASCHGSATPRPAPQTPGR
jgi:poly-gamma-glutamate capsule biosynthesis protein CapA/YwtB (metallophosphatase superfamily)